MVWRKAGTLWIIAIILNISDLFFTYFMLADHNHESNVIVSWLWNHLGFTGVVLWKVWWVSVASVLTFIVWLHKTSYGLLICRIAVISLILTHLLFAYYWIQYNAVTPL